MGTKYGYSFHEDVYPVKQNCEPDSSLDPFVYIRSAENPRLFPPVPGDSQRCRDIMNLRSGSERVNALGVTGEVRPFAVPPGFRWPDFQKSRHLMIYISHSQYAK